MNKVYEKIGRAVVEITSITAMAAGFVSIFLYGIIK